MRAIHRNQTLPNRSLLDLCRGESAVVCGFDPEVPTALARRLVSMGLSIGTEAEVLLRRRRGPILLRVRDARIALGQDEARGVRIEDALNERDAPQVHADER